MSGIAPPATAGRAGVAPATAAPIPTGSPAPLMPEPCLTNARLQDAMGSLYQFLSVQGQNGVASAENQVNVQTAVRDLHFQREQDAIGREEAAAGQGSRGFFASIGHLLSDVAGDLTHLRIADAVSDSKDDIGAALSSPQFWRDLASGATTVLKGAELVMASAVAFYVAGPAGVAYVVAEPNSPATKACTLAGETALTVATCGAAAPTIAGTILVTSAVALSASGYVISETGCLDHTKVAWLGTALQLGGGALALGVAGGGTDRTVQTLLGAQKAVTGGAQTVAGVADVKVAGFDGDAEDARADQQAQRLDIERLERAVRWVLDNAKWDKESNQRTLETLRGAMNTNDQTAVASAAALRG